MIQLVTFSSPTSSVTVSQPLIPGHVFTHHPKKVTVFKNCQVYLQLYTPWKINMQPKNGGLVQMMFLFNWVIFWFQPLIFRGLSSKTRFSPLRHLRHLFFFGRNLKNIDTAPEAKKISGKKMSFFSFHLKKTYVKKKKTGYISSHLFLLLQYIDNGDI